MSHTFSKKLFSDSKVGFMTSGEKSNNHFAQSQASAMGAMRVNVTGCNPETN
jgi:hypothetical protein